VLFGDAGECRRVVGLAVALVALACALAVPAVASAESFLVNSVADETDADPGDEFCLTAAAKCTLRAAIEVSNALGGGDSLDFEEEGLFDGGVSGTILLAKPLPTIEGEIEIFGECGPSGGALRPCVGVDGPGATEPAFSVKNAEGVTISGLAITGAGTGIDAVGTTRIKVLGNWFGVKLDRSSKGNGTGVLLGPGAHRSLIGNGGEEPNVFAASAEVALDLSGATSTEVLGDYFGVAPDGITAAPNGKDIEVTGVGSGPAASGTKIGTLLSSEAVATPACDGGCNVISGAASSGIDLEGDGGEEVPATETSIAGNYIGLDASGTVAVANAGDGVRVGQAARTLIGGPRAGEANRFAGGGDSAVLAGPAAPNLVIRGNAIGVGSTGAALPAPDDGIAVTSEGIPSAAEVVIAANEIRMQGGVAIAQNGLGGWIDGNQIFGAGIGISTSGYEEHGNLIEDNRIEHSALNAILIENELNEVLGNTILFSGAAGIRLHAVDPFFRTFLNRIGGNTAAQENTISQSGGPAVEIASVEHTENEVARNRGAGNGGLFIDIVALSPSTEPKGPNNGIAPPVFEDLTESGASGSAEPDARVRVFRKAGPSPGELQSFLGEAIADEDGVWALAFDAPLPPGTAVAATQTGGGGGTSELAIATSPAAPVSTVACPAAANCAPPPAKGAPPQAKIFKGSKGKKFVKATAAFKFKASVEGSTFQCRLDGKPFRKCHSPKVYTGLKPGRHRFEVRAIGPDGQVGAPARLKFSVLT
jgi:CSLREA domain-containing protein